MKKVFLLPSVLLLCVGIYAQSKPSKKVTKTKKSTSGTTLSSTAKLKTENEIVLNFLVTQQQRDIPQ